MNDKSYNLRIHKRWVRVALIVATTALIVAPLTAIASHSFTDVPDTNTFHSDIAWLADAGVTKGCNPPANTEFCPNDNVSRGQMSAFLRRLSENKVVDAATAVNADHATTAVNADHATTAVNADHATTAVNADHATTAGDADTVDGSDADDFVLATQLLHASVGQDGTLIVGNATSAVRTSTGRYTVEFDRNLNNCSATMSAGLTGVDVGFNFGATMGVQLLNNEAIIYMAFAAGVPVPAFDNDFHLIVVCPTNEAAPLSSASQTEPEENGFETTP